VKLIARPSVQAAKIASFTWIDLQEAQPDAQRIVLLNDLATADSADDEQLVAKPKLVNESVTSILKGYSNKIYSWSAAINDPDFARKISQQ